MKNAKRNWFHVFSKNGKKNTFADKINSVKQSKDDWNAFKKFLKLDEVYCHVLSAMCATLGKRNNIKQMDLIDSLEEHLSMDVVTQSIYELTIMGWIQFELDGPFHSTPVLIIAHDGEVALKTSNPDYFPHYNMSIEKREQLELYVKAIQFRAKDFGVKEWIKYTTQIIKGNTKPFMQLLKESKASKESTALALFLLAIYPLEEESVDLSKVVKLFASDSIEAVLLKKQLNDTQHPLYTSGVLERNANMRGEVFLKPYGSWLNAFLTGDSVEQEKQPLPQTLQKIEFNSIMERQLRYNINTQESVQQLFEIVEDEHYSTYVQEVKKQRENAGIILLLSGGPGTGKTELAKQLARSSQRDLLLFDVSKQRNMFLGESEKAIQEVFRKYQEIVQKSKLVPILFFNESDSILQSRNSNYSNLSQTENAVLTILLNEMENFNGILICTTNRPEAMDDAFHRRFLFHLHIDEPNECVRFQLLTQEFPEACPIKLHEMSERYPFTGANLQTFHQQNIISRITRSKKQGLEDALEQFFQSLFLAKNNRMRIGF